MNRLWSGIWQLPDSWAHSLFLGIQP